MLPAFAWGFLHSNYPQEPAYIRGIEVGLIGIVAGLVMLRWGIWATLIWHYTVDAFLISTSLLRSHGAYLRVSGAIVGGAALIPLAIAAISYFSRGGFVTDRIASEQRSPSRRTAGGGDAGGNARSRAGSAFRECRAGSFAELHGHVFARAGCAGCLRRAGRRACWPA